MIGPDSRPGRAIVLIGMPGAGKSTVGVLLAKQAARPFVDTDLLMQARAGLTLQQIIDRQGLEAFRRLEGQIVQELRLSGEVVATGGSVIYSAPAMRHLADAGDIVYLHLPVDLLSQRLTDLGTRGVVKPANMSLEELYVERAPLYERWAHATIDCRGRNHQAVVDAIRSALAI